MTQLTPTTSYHDRDTLMHQIMSIDRGIAGGFPMASYTQHKQSETIIETITLFQNSTGDCGRLLGWHFPAVTWMVRTSNGDIISILSQDEFSGSFLTAISIEQIIGDQSPSTLPHVEALRRIKEVTGLSQERIRKLLNVTRQTLNLWEKGRPIEDANRRKLFAVRDVLERAARRYTSPDELVVWLDTPQGVDGHTPAELIEMNEINQARLLAVSFPSPTLVRPPVWVNRAIPEAFRDGGERRQEPLSPEPNDEMTDAEAAAYEVSEEEEGVASDEQSKR